MKRLLTISLTSLIIGTTSGQSLQGSVECQSPQYSLGDCDPDLNLTRTGNNI